MYLKSIQLQKFLKVRKMWHCLRKKGGSWWVAQPLWYMNRFLMFSSVVINSADIWGNVLLSHHQQRSYLQWPHLNSAKTVILGFEGKPNCFVLFWICSLPFLSYWMKPHKRFKSPLLAESYEHSRVQNKGVYNSVFHGNVANFYFFLSNSSI